MVRLNRSETYPPLEMIPTSEVSIGDRFRKDLGTIKGLAKSISECGLINPILVIRHPRGTMAFELVTGFRRLKAFELLGRSHIPAIVLDINSFEEFDCRKRPIDDTTGLPIRYRLQLDENLFHKKLTESELAGIQGLLRAHYNRYIAHQGRRTDLEKGKSTYSKNLEKVKYKHGWSDWAAGIVEQSHTTIEKRQALYDVAAARPKLYQQSVIKPLDQGKISLPKAFRLMKMLEAKRELLESDDNIQELGSEYKISLHNKDFKNAMNDLMDNSVDLFFVDPPYAEEHLHYYAKIAKVAMRKLKPGGCLVVYLSHRYLPQVLKDIESQGLTYYWLFDIPLNGPTSTDYERRIHIKHKPLLCFTKGEPRLTRTFIMDRVMKSKMPEKKLHPWQQSTDEALYYIDGLTRKGGIVVDLMMGTGTTGIAALSLGRQFVGYEIDVETIAIAQKNITRAIKIKKT